jgi:hypothetical protein
LRTPEIPFSRALVYFWAMYRSGERDLEGVLNNLSERLESLENAASRRLLPPGYIWTITGGQLVVKRESDGQEQVVL